MNATNKQFGEAMRSLGYESKTLPKAYRDRVKELSKLESVPVPNMHSKNYATDTGKGLAKDTTEGWYAPYSPNGSITINTGAKASKIPHVLDHEIGHHVDNSTRTGWNVNDLYRRMGFKETFADDYARYAYQYRNMDTALKRAEEVGRRSVMSHANSGALEGVYAPKPYDFSTPAGLTPGQITAQKLRDILARLDDPLAKPRAMREIDKFYRQYGEP